MDLVCRYPSDSIVRNTVCQATGHHVKYNTEYGFITTYCHTWITKLSTNGVFWISRAFDQDARSSESTLNALLFAVCSALKSKQRDAWAAPQLNLVTETVSVKMDSSSSESECRAESGEEDTGKSSTSSMRISDVDGRSVMLILESVMQAHPDRVTYIGRKAEDNVLLQSSALRAVRIETRKPHFTGSWPRSKESTSRDAWAAVSWGIGTSHVGLR